MYATISLAWCLLTGSTLSTICASLTTSARLITGVNTSEIEIPQTPNIDQLHYIQCNTAKYKEVPWLASSLGCSIKYILALALLTIYFLKFHPYQLSLSSPDPITKSYSEFQPISHFYELLSFSSPLRSAFYSILYFVKYGIPAFRN